jgi:glucokinase
MQSGPVISRAQPAPSKINFFSSPRSIPVLHASRRVPAINMKSRASGAGCTVLVADIGGTNCRFQLWELDTYLRPAVMSLEQIYQTSAYDRFDQALDAFLATDAAKSSPPQAAAFACAGPVRKQRCEFTNLGWVVDADEVSKQFNLRSRVLNDFEAVGYGVPALGEHDILVLNNVPAEEKGPKAVLGPGTGLGEAQLFWDDSINNYKVYASEGSHATFAPRGWKQRALQARVEAERGHCSVERVACGSGLVRIYDFLHSDEVSNRPGVTKLTNPTPADVSIAAMSGNDPIATEALDMLLAIVGAEASHMALRSLSSGGVYIAGGILPKVVERVKQGGVLEAFLWKASRFHDKVLKDIPLYVVLEERVGLIGSREQAIQLVQMARDDVYIST